MSRMILNPTNVSGTTNASAGTYDQLLAAETEERAYLYVENPSTNTTEVITVADGAEGSEKGLLTLKAGEFKEWKVDPLTGLNDVPQGRIAIKASANSTAFFARHKSIAKLA